MDYSIKHSFDEMLLQLTRVGLPSQPISPRKILLEGERAGEIASYVVGWLVGKGIEVIVLDGANRFNPYTVSALARRVLIPPESLLKRIRIARAFTCYQMAIMITEKLPSLLITESQKPWIILLGPITTFLDEDVSEREVRPLFERSLRKIEEVALRGIPFLLFQHPVAPGSKRAHLMKRLFQFTSELWRIDLDDEGPKMILEEGVGLNIIENCKLQNEKCNFERENFTASW